MRTPKLSNTILELSLHDICLKMVRSDFDCRSFISEALAIFRINSGIALPTDVVYDYWRGSSFSFSSSSFRIDRDEQLAQFHATIMIFFQTLLQSPLRLEKDGQGKVMMFYY